MSSLPSFGERLQALGGPALSRTAARAKVTDRELRRQMEAVWYDSRLSEKLRDEAPAAYKDIKTRRAVLSWECQ